MRQVFSKDTPEEKSVSSRPIRLLSDSLIGLLAIASAVLIWHLLTANPAAALTMDTPGSDGKPDHAVREVQSVKVGEFFTEYGGRASLRPGSWPKFRGKKSDNRLESSRNLRMEEPARILWELSLGEGHAGAAVYIGRVYVLDYDEENQADALRCLSMDTGEEIWRRWYRVKTKRNHGMSRTIPAVTDDFVLTMGPQCYVMAVNAISGELLWSLNLAGDFGAEVPLWYTGQCPLIDGMTAVLAVGGVNLFMGVDCATGEILWETANPEGYRMSHSSVVIADILGKRTYVYSALGGIVGISAEEEDRGKMLWSSADFDATVIAPSPVYLGDGRIFSTAGYGAGSILLRVFAQDQGFAVETIYQKRPQEGFSCEQQTPLVHEGYLFGILTKDAGPLRGQFVCYDPEKGVVWSSGEQNRFGLGPYLYVDGTFLILSDEGLLTQIEASKYGYREIGSIKILDGVDAWAPMALVDGLLFARDSRTMVCVDIGA